MHAPERRIRGQFEIKHHTRRPVMFDVSWQKTTRTSTVTALFHPDNCRQFVPPKPDVVASFELHYKIELPPDYKEFLQTYGGGRFSNCFVDYPAAPDPDPTIIPHAGINWLESLHGLSHDGQYGFDDLENNNNDNRVYPDESGQLLLFGNTIDGSNLFLSVSSTDGDDDVGWVYLHQGTEEIYICLLLHI